MAHRTCGHCGADIAHTHANQRYCSPRCRDAKKWLMRPRIPCSECEQPTGWTLTGREGDPRLSVERVRCWPCRRKGSTYRVSNKRAKGYVDRWDCQGCGVACERPATKGQRPKYCEMCRKLRHNPLIRLKAGERLALYERDEWMCQLCGESVDADLIGTHSPWRPSLDHIQPRSLGGSDDPENLRLAHNWCNSVRGAGRHDDLFQGAS